MTDKKQKKVAPPSPENVYHILAGSDPDLAARDGILYRWTGGSFWAAQDVMVEESRAFRWLQTQYPDKATPPLARRCVEAAVMGATTLPAPAKSAVVLPLQNVYLHVDTKTGATKTLAPDKAIGLTYQIACNYDPNARAPRFGQFLCQVLPDDPDSQGYIQEYIGYTFLHDCRYQTALFWIGGGANGKTTLAQIISSLHRKVISLQLNALEGFQLAQLIDASLVVVDETPQRINEQKFKTLVSGGPCPVDRKYRDQITFHPSAKWIILGNSAPAISDQSHGFWRRFPVVPFKQQFSAEEQDPELVSKITEREMPGVLNWAVEGLVRLIKRRRFPTMSAAMEEAQDECKQETNSVLSWWRDNRVVFDENFETPRDEIYTDYKKWCADNGMAALGVERFWNRLKFTAGSKATEPTARKIQKKVVRVVPLRLLNEQSHEPKKVIAGRW